MNRNLYPVGAALISFTFQVRPAGAGMPSANLTDLGAMRFEAISFFAFGLILCAAFIQALWNWLRKDFPRLPMLTYGKACAIVALWGLLFVIVLTMISGARELMTPGAWVKSGSTYKLASPSATKNDQTDQAASPAESSKEKLLALRRKKLHDLGEALTQFAAAHQGQFPADIASSGLGEEQWQLPGGIDMQYKYVSGATTAAKTFLVAYEPNVFDNKPLALFADSRVMAMGIDEILNSLPSGGSQ